MHKEEFGLKVREYRDKLGYTLKDLELLTGISQSYLSRIENNKNQASLSTILKLHKVLKFDDDFMVDNGYELYGVNIDKQIESDKRLDELVRKITLYKARGNADLDDVMGLLEIIQDIIKN